MGKGQELRFAVLGEDGRASAVWRVWTSAAGDAYVAIRSLGGVEKVSLHASGDWRYGYTVEREPSTDPDLIPPGSTDLVVRGRTGGGIPSSERVIWQWRRPSPSAHGYVVAIRLAVPVLCCTGTPEPSTRRKPIYYTPVLATWTALMVTYTLVISEVDDRTGYPRPGSDDPSSLIGRLNLDADHYLWVVASVGPLQQNVMEASVSEFGKYFTLGRNDQILGRPDTRMASFGHLDDDDHTPWMLDLDPIVAAAAWAKYIDDHGGSREQRQAARQLGRDLAARRLGHGRRPPGESSDQ